MNDFIQRELMAVFRQQRRNRLAWQLAACWSGLALIGLVILLARQQNQSSPIVWMTALGIVAVIAGAILIARNRRRQPDWSELARRVELKFPELNGLLLTAVQQQPGSEGALHHLQERVVREALQHSASHSWRAAVPPAQAIGAQLAHFVALLLLLAVFAGFRSSRPANSVFGEGWTQGGVTITPGDATIERGERLVVVASFKGSVPANVELIIPSSDGTNRIPLVKSLADPVFGGSISEVTTGFVYRVEYGGKRSRDFTVKVFEFPRLERADADLTFPDYTALSPKRIENTRRISAVEGTRCDLTLQFNKPMARAELVAKGESNQPIPLAVSTNQPLATLGSLLLETNRTYLLRLVDADGRTNKVPTQFVFNVLRNREPELKIVSPRGDTRPSALEEVSFEGTVWDDFGVRAYGMAYVIPGNELKFIELGQSVPANEKHPFKQLLRLEELGAQPDQLISWFLWAEDIGPDGKIRRTMGDMYFAEVRPFDEIFRQSQNGGGGESGGGESGSGGNQQSKLAELQKQIINATWKLQREQSRREAPSQNTNAVRETKTSSARTDVRTAMASASFLNFAPNENGAETVALRAHRISFTSRFPMFGQKRIGGTSYTSPTLSFASHFQMFGQRAPRRASDDPANGARESLSRIGSTNKTDSASQFADDLAVVREAVAQATEQAKSQRESPSGLQNARLWDELIQELEKSGDALDRALKSPDSLAEALAAEQSAFQVILKLQQREYEVSRNRNRAQNSGNNRDQQMQRQLQQLDLTQPENRYENERLAQSPMSAARREQVQIMNRLGELARRQQDLNERLKELQTALQEAKTEQEREELRRQLKRLQEEEQRMLADVDELQQRMNQQENQSNMSEQRQQLEQTRQEMQRTAEAAQEGSASQALASGTRAQRQLQQMREDLRKQNSSEFAEDLKQLRADAREAERQQQEIQKQLGIDSSRGEARKLDDSAERQRTLEQLAQQAKRLTNLVNRAAELSRQTEEAEPLASRELYDALRQFAQEDANTVRSFQDELIQNGMLRSRLYQRLNEIAKDEGVKSVELTSEMLREGLQSPAQQSGERASSQVSNLARGIERAAEKVLGDDTEALRTAQQQLEELTKQIEREMSRNQDRDSTNATALAGNAQEQSNPTASQHDGAENRSANERSADSQSSRPQSEEQASGGQPGESQRSQDARAQSDDNRNAQQPGSSQNSASQSDENGGSSEERTAQSRSPASAQNGRANRSLRDRNATDSNNPNGQLPAGFEQFFDAGTGGNPNAPVFTGDGFVPWSDRLREVEEMVDSPALQSELATARERARLLRQEFKRSGQPPDWPAVESQVVKPLVEVHDHIAEELARRGSRETLVPVDRDPVPNRFSELVRKYYEELGK